MKLIIFILNMIFWVSCSTVQREEVKTVETEDTKPIEFKFDQVGFATIYGKQFQGKSTESGEIFDNEKLTAAHRDMPLGSIIKVQNLENNKIANLKINDRGYKPEFLLEVSGKAADELNIDSSGVAKVGVNIIEKPIEDLKLMKDDSFGVDDDDEDDEDDVDDETAPPVKTDTKKKPPVVVTPPPTKTTTPPSAKVVTPPAKKVENPPVVQIPTEVPTTSTSKNSSQPKGFTVQIGVFKEEKRAENFREAIKKEYSEKIFLFSRAGTFVVQIGDFAKRTDAESLRDKLKANNVPNCFIPPKF
jgi:rare lipoprotein A